MEWCLLKVVFLVEEDIVKEKVMNKLLMVCVIVVWLVDNMMLSFKQIGDFCGMYELEVQGIVDGDVVVGVKGFDLVGLNQLDQIEIEKGQKDLCYKLCLKYNFVVEGEEKCCGLCYMLLFKCQDRFVVILWLVKFYLELVDVQIVKLVGMIKLIIVLICECMYWNIQNILLIDLVVLGLCCQFELDVVVQKVVKCKVVEGGLMIDDECCKLLFIEILFLMLDELWMLFLIVGFENFSLIKDEEDEVLKKEYDVDSFFNLFEVDDDDEDDDNCC